MSLHVEIIDTGNDAFLVDREGECALILRRLADHLESNLHVGGSLRDTNGNKVGRWWWSE